MRKKVIAFLVTLAATLGTAQKAHAAFSYETGYDAWRIIGALEYRNGVPLGLLHSMSLVETGVTINRQLLPWPFTVGVNATGKRNFSSVSAAYNELAKLRNMGFSRFDATVNGRSTSGAKAAKVEEMLAAAQGDSSANITLVGLNFARRFETQTEAAQFARTMLSYGYDNMDFGLMQVNWRVHKRHFPSVEAAFDPYTNATYAVSYLGDQRVNRSWWASVGRYHSATPVHAKRYITSVWNMYRRVRGISSVA